jgi:hypothetical protein
VPLDINDLLDNCWPQIHAEGEGDALFVTVDTMIRFFSDALKKLAQRYGVFVVRHIARELVQGQLYYAAPPRHLSTLHIALWESGRALVASSTKEQELRATAWATTQATTLKPIRWWVEDKAGVNQIGLVPLPSATEATTHWDVIYHSYPCDVLDGIETIATWGDYLEACVLAEAYIPESDFSIPESAASYRSLADLFETIAMQYWGKAQ